MDDGDRAAAQAELERKLALGKRQPPMVHNQCFNEVGKIICCRCNLYIAKERLSILPTTHLCVDCASEREIK